MSKPIQGEKYYDETGFEINEGDLLQVFHFRHYLRKQKMYMYKVVIIKDGYYYGREYNGEHTYGLWCGADENKIIKGTKVLCCHDLDSYDRLKKEASIRLKNIQTPTNKFN